MSDDLAGPPAAAWRLLPDHDPADLDSREHLPLLIGRLLEDGDSADLRWLTGRCREDEITAWVRQRGDRQLSARSRAFWTLVLGLDAEAHEENPLWSL